jgi:hypothetical protein
VDVSTGLLRSAPQLLFFGSMGEAREAGGSIKSGARAQDCGARYFTAHEMGDSVDGPTLSPARGLYLVFQYRSWGLRPRLYAYAYFAG